MKKKSQKRDSDADRHLRLKTMKVRNVRRETPSSASMCITFEIPGGWRLKEFEYYQRGEYRSVQMPEITALNPDSKLRTIYPIGVPEEMEEIVEQSALKAIDDAIASNHPAARMLREFQSYQPDPMWISDEAVPPNDDD